MYLCIAVSGNEAIFAKCQTLSPTNMQSGFPPYNRIEVHDIGKTAFRHKTLIDCDKVFIFPAASIAENVIVEQAITNDLAVEIIERTTNSDRIKYTSAELKALNIKNIN
jgi:hypothetical protein